MANNRDGFSDHLTFSQRYGYEPLPEQMRLEELSSDLKREIWNAIRKLLLEYRRYSRAIYYFNAPGTRFIEHVLGKLYKKPEYRINTSYKEVMHSFESLLLGEEKFNKILDLIEFMVNDRDIKTGFVNRVENLFKQHAAAYRLDTSEKPYKFFPQSSQEQGETTYKAIETLRKNNMNGAATHLRKAAEYINAKNYAASIADSIHAVESVARMIDPEASKTLGPALNSLEKTGLLKHKALKEAFDKLYGYTNTEQGIRHALLGQDSSDAGLDEAMFMFGGLRVFRSLSGQQARTGRTTRVRQPITALKPPRLVPICLLGICLRRNGCQAAST